MGHGAWEEGDNRTQIGREARAPGGAPDAMQPERLRPNVRRRHNAPVADTSATCTRLWASRCCRCLPGQPPVCWIGCVHPILICRSTGAQRRLPRSRRLRAQPTPPQTFSSWKQEVTSYFGPVEQAKVIKARSLAASASGRAPQLHTLQSAGVAHCCFEPMLSFRLSHLRLRAKSCELPGPQLLWTTGTRVPQLHQQSRHRCLRTHHRVQR